MIKIKDSIIGEGIPKICVPIVEKTQEAILDQAQEIVSESVDIVEWRLDFYDDVHDIDCVIQTADLLQSILGKTVLLLTFRTKKEGGQKDVSLEEYKRLLLAVAKSGKTDMIDVEAFRGYDVSEQKETFSVDDTENEAIRSLINELSGNVCVIGSYHDFEKTPTKEEMIQRLLFIDQMGADIPKMAVMPHNGQNVLDLMQATLLAKEKTGTKPLITMAMGDLGKITRIAGISFGSAVTFGCLGKASAPGQIEVENLRKTLSLLGKEE